MKKNMYYSFIVTLIFFGRHFLTVGDPPNAFYYNQTLNDYYFILTLCLSFFLVMSAAFCLVENFVKKSYGRFLFAVLGLSLLPLLDFVGLAILGKNLPINPGIGRAIFPFLTLFYIPLIIFTAVRFKVEKFAERIVAILSIVSLVVIYYGVPRFFGVTHIEGEFAAGRRTPVYIMIFDATSYEVLNSPELRSYFPNFKKLAGESFVFTDAHSPGHNTINSIPKILTGINYGRLQRKDQRLLVLKSGSKNFNELPTNDSIFHLARTHGYNTVLIGNVLPYCNLFGKDLTYGYVRPYTAKLQLVLPLAFTALLNVTSLAARENVLNTFDKTFLMIAAAPLNTLFFLHFPVPHFPFVFDVHGYSHNYWDYIFKGGSYNYTERYVKQLRYADRKLGEIIDELKKKKLFDSALIIVAADHNHPTKYGGQRDMTKIPLFIKAPFQGKGYLVGGRSNLINLKPFLSEYFDSGAVEIKTLLDADGAKKCLTNCLKSIQ